MRRSTALTMVAIVSTTAFAANVAGVHEADHFGPLSADALVFKGGELPNRLTIENDWLGIGGPDAPDCLDFGGDTPLAVISDWEKYPSVAFKSLGERVELNDEVGVEVEEIETVCETAGRSTTSDPQRIGTSAMALRSEDLWVPIAFFPTSYSALSAELTTCIVEPGATFTSSRNRGAGAGETALPNEAIDGTITSECVDHTEAIAGGGWGPGGINFTGSGFLAWSVYSSPDPERDMGPGLWAFCVDAIIHDALSDTQQTESDYTWFWVEDTNLGFADGWANPMNWDGEAFNFPWNAGEFSSQQPCDTLGSFQG